MELNQKVIRPTTHNRVFTETSDKANEVARMWNCSKVEVYRWLVEMALEGKIKPVSRKDTNK